jgi:hypothetical protein
MKMPKAERKHELFRLPLATILKDYRRIKGVAEGTQAPEMLVGQMIQTILDAEYPKSK